MNQRQTALLLTLCLTSLLILLTLRADHVAWITNGLD